jgi:hypothetical protein
MYKLIIPALTLLLMIVGCSSKKGLVGNEVTSKVKPVKPIEAEAPESLINLVVKAGNIADLSTSNRNRFELYINSELINPKNKIDNSTANYVYQLQLVPGYYEVKGIYYWHDGWREERTKVRTHDLVKVEEFSRTVLEINIPKDWRGMVTEDDLIFNISQKSLYRQDQQGYPQPDVVQQQVETGPKVKLQINTDPDNCDVILNDEMVGQTPITVWIDRNTSHVVQLKYPGYRTKMRLIDQEGLKTRDKLIMLERLEPSPYIVNQFQSNPPINNPNAVSQPANNSGADSQAANNEAEGGENENQDNSTNPDTTSTTTATTDTTANNNGR